jgi:hypothetical protein
VARGFATWGTDSGHDNKKLAHPRAFALNNESLVNMAYAAYKKTHDMGVRIARAFYDLAPAKTYFYGGSEGGREALMMAQRFPTDFDGIVSVMQSLALQVQEALKRDPHAGDLYVFRGRSGMYIDKNDVIYVADSESRDGRTSTGQFAYAFNPGAQRGIRIGSAADGSGALDEKIARQHDAAATWPLTEVVRAFSRDGLKPLLGLVRRQKLGIDPALPAGVLDLDPIPLPACRCELRAPGGGAKNGRLSGGGRPDVDTGTLQKDEFRVLRRGGGLACHGIYSNLGRSQGGEGSRNIGRRNHTGRSGRWPSHSRGRLHLSLGWPFGRDDSLCLKGNTQ